MLNQALKHDYEKRIEWKEEAQTQEKGEKISCCYQKIVGKNAFSRNFTNLLGDKKSLYSMDK